MTVETKLNDEIRPTKEDVQDNVSLKSNSASSVSTGSTSKGLIKRYKPFDKPVKPIRVQDPDLTEEQQEKYDSVLKYFQEFVETEIPVNESEEAPKHKATEEEIAWLTKECFLRYLRSSKWKTDVAIKRVKETMIWRRSFGVVDIPGYTEQKLITADLVEHENETGKNVLLGYDVDNRPCLYLRNGYQNTTASLRQVQHLVYMLEKVIQFMVPGQDGLALLIDFKAAPKKLNLSSNFPSISISKQVLYILNNHYPERLGRGLFTNIPWYGYTFFKLVGPFIGSHIRSRTIYDQPFENFVPREQLDKEFKGLLDFEYIHDVYWPEVNSMAEKKHARYMTKFREMGGKIGLSENDLRSGL